MKKLASLYLIFFTLTLLSSCSSLDRDAKKAAKLNRKSLDYIKEQNLGKAEEAYRASQEIVAQYKGTEQYIEFHRIYSEYMLEENPKK